MDFDKAVEVILESEGGYVNHPKDPGGETRYGITKRVAMNYGYIGDMKVLPINTAADIYKKLYWDACKCDELPWPLSLYVFDAAVNQGVGAATKMLQSVVGVTQDGVIGQVTLKKAEESPQKHATEYLKQQ